MRGKVPGRPVAALAIVTTFLALSCGGGGGGGGGGQTPPNVAFVTSVTGTGNLSTWADAGGQSGLAAADAVCQARADAAGLAGTFGAWMSDSSNDAYCRVLGLSGTVAGNCGQPSLPTNAGPWVRTDGFPFAGTLDQLTSGVVYAPIRYDEFGAQAPPSILYFTATRPDGTLDAGSCSDWTDPAGLLPAFGDPETTGEYWTDAGSSACASSRALLCMETGTGGALPSFATPGKLVFVTSVSGNGALGSWPQAGGQTGAAAGDAICRDLANTAGFANTSNFVAWLSDSSSNAGSVVTSDGPWVRPDGVKVADSKTDLLDGELFAPINVTDTLQYELFTSVWTGTDADGSANVATCQDWSFSGPGSTASRGRSVAADADWTEDGTNNCNVAMRLYCIED